MTLRDTAVIGATVLSTITFVLVLVGNGYAAQGGTKAFPNSVVNVSNKFYTDITPAGYTFAIWGVIYGWNALWLAYSLADIFRTNTKGPVLLNPVVLTIPCQLSWILSGLANISWLSVWCHENILGSFLLLSILTVSGLFSLRYLSVALAKNESEIYYSSKTDYWLNYILYQNGLGCYYSWTTIATMVNLSSVLAYDDSIINPTLSITSASVISLLILLCIVVFWSVLENTVLFQYVHYLYIWYVVLVWAAVGVLVGNFDLGNPSTILTILIIIVALVCLVIKINVYIYKTRPKSYSNMKDVESKSFEEI